MEPTHDLIILGAGPAGLTAGIYAGRAKLRTLLLGDRPGGGPLLYDRIDNYPGFPGGVPGAQLMLGMLQQVDALGVERLVADAEGVALDGETKLVRVGETTYGARALILATGSEPARLQVPGEEPFVGKGIYYCAHCDAPIFQHLEKARATVIGGGNSAIETALYVSRYAEQVTLVHRGPELRADRIAQAALAARPGIRLLLNHAPTGIRGADGELRAVQLRNTATGEETELASDGVFVGIGQRPNSAIAGDLVERDAAGFIRVGPGMETSTPGVFAAGDVIGKELRQIVTSAADGAVAAHSAIRCLQRGCCSR